MTKVVLYPGLARMVFRANSRPGHFSGGASGPPFPLKEQFGIRFVNVLVFLDAQLLRGGIDPFSRALDLSEVADGRLVHHNMPFGLFPLSAELLVAEARM